MTTYATPTTTQPAPPYGGPPATPRGPSVVPPRPRRRTGIVAAAGALAIALAATAAAVITLTHPVTPAQHTIDVVAPPPATYSSADIQAAKGTACSGWENAALATALASKTRAGVPTDPASLDARFDARAGEKRVGASQIAYLRTQISPATPVDVSGPINEWISSEIDRLHYVNMRDWPAASASLDRGNNLVDVITPRCGLR
jgi:hypothetical protein